MSEKYMVSQTIKYSDGTETTMEYTANPNQEVIEETVHEAVIETSPESIEDEEVSNTEIVEGLEGEEEQGDVNPVLE